MTTPTKTIRPRPRLAQALTEAKREGWSRWVRSEQDERAVLAGCRFVEAMGRRVEEFFRRFLRQSKGTQWAGKPFELAEWQRDRIIYPLFGWMRKDGTRRFRRASVWIPKKNGKSTLCAGIGTYLLSADNEPGAEVYSAATDREQASIVHGEAISMVDSSPGLSQVLQVNRSTKTIHHRQARGWYRALSADARSSEGLNAHAILIDELHAWRDRKYWSSLKWAFAARVQPLLVIISTAGDDMQSIAREQYEYAKAVLEGTHKGDDAIECLPVIYEADEAKDDLEDERTWHKANPALGQIISIDSFRADFQEARRTPAEWAAFKRYRLDIWTTATNPAIRTEDWQACRRDYTEEDLAGRPCVLSLDLARVNDMSCGLLLFPEDQPAEELELEPEADRAAPPVPAEAPDAQPKMVNPEVAGALATAIKLRIPVRTLCRFWMPEQTIWDPSNPNAPLYQGWLAAGLLKATSGGEVAHEEIAADLLEWVRPFQLRACVYDPMFATWLAQHLEAQLGIQRVEFTQNATTYAAPVEAFERAVLGHRFGHNGNAIQTWHAGNLAFHTNRITGWKRPVKPADGIHRKIDSAVAGIQAMQAILKPELIGPMQSVYEEHGIEWLE